jgi:hypothetical protein
MGPRPHRLGGLRFDLWTVDEAVSDQDRRCGYATDPRHRSVRRCHLSRRRLRAELHLLGRSPACRRELRHGDRTHAAQTVRSRSGLGMKSCGLGTYDRRHGRRCCLRRARGCNRSGGGGGRHGFRSRNVDHRRGSGNVGDGSRSGGDRFRSRGGDDGRRGGNLGDRGRDFQWCRLCRHRRFGSSFLCSRRQRSRGARGQERQWVHVALRVARDPNTEVDIGLVVVDHATRADAADHRGLTYGRASLHSDRTEMDERRRVPERRLDRDRLAARRNRARERDDPFRRRQHRCTRRGAEIDPAVLATRIRMDTVEQERSQHRSLDRPGPGTRNRNG